MNPTKDNRHPFLSPQTAASLLRQGGVVAVPTETVYGLAADAFNPLAVERIFSIKRRPANDPLIVHIFDATPLASLTTSWPEAAAKLARHFWPGPLTMILPKTPQVPDIVTANLPTVGIRMPAHPVMRDILRLCRCPLAAPSANRFGAISPTTAQHVADSLGNEPDGIVDGGPCEIGLESTIVAFAHNNIWIMRPGILAPDEIAAVTGLPVLPYQPAHALDIPAPGTMPRHYAPNTPIAWMNAPQARTMATGNWGHLQFGHQTQNAFPTPPKTALNLSDTANLAEAANRLYDALRYLDRLNLDAILIDPIPDSGIGSAINDRLHRACKP